MSNKKLIAVVGATGTQGGGLVRAILADPNSSFSVRAITRDIHSEKAKNLAKLGAELFAADIDDQSSVEQAFRGAYGAYCVTPFWEHFSPERELAQATHMAKAAKAAKVQHVIWSTLEDTRRWIPLSDNRMPTLMGKYKVPHFDAKGEANHVFTELGLPVTLFQTSFYWDNLIHFGMGPKRGADGTLAITLPMGDKKLAGIAAEDIGHCAYAIFKQGNRFVGKTVSVAGDHPTVAQMAATMSKVLGQKIVYNAVTPAAYRGFGFPGAEDLGNMFQFYQEFERDFCGARNLEAARALHPGMLTFEQWVMKNKDRIALD